MEPLSSMTEDSKTSDLLAACRNGDRDAMRSLYVEYQRSVFSIALNFFAGDRERAEDVTQQVFIKLLKGVNFAGRSQFTTWLYRLTVNQCIDETRKTRRFIPFADWFTPGEPVTRISLSDELDSKAISDEVRAVVCTLKPKYRLPIV